MTEDFINVYGNYAIKLLRLQNDLIQTFDRYQRGNKQTVEVIETRVAANETHRIYIKPRAN